jgi:hypothetical protein
VEYNIDSSALIAEISSSRWISTVNYYYAREAIMKLILLLQKHYPRPLSLMCFSVSFFSSNFSTEFAYGVRLASPVGKKIWRPRHVALTWTCVEGVWSEVKWNQSNPAAARTNRVDG